MLKECHCKIKFVSLVPNPFFKSSLLAFIINMIGCRDNTHWKKINSWTSIHLFIRFMVSSHSAWVFCLRTGIIQLPRFFTQAREWTEIVTQPWAPGSRIMHLYCRGNSNWLPTFFRLHRLYFIRKPDKHLIGIMHALKLTFDRWYTIMFITL